MPRKNKEKILHYLYKEHRDSNMSVKTECNIADSGYPKAKKQLLDQGLIDKYKCRGGGIELTEKGKKKAKKIWEKFEGPDIDSKVGRERELYTPFQETLEKEVEENEESAVICQSHRMNISGKWSNPDITKVAIRNYEYLNKKSVFVTTYEIKRWDSQGFDVKHALETAGQNRFAHQSFLALEFPDKEIDVDDHLDDRIFDVCERFGIGLMKFHPYKDSEWRMTNEKDGKVNSPADENTEEYLENVFRKFEQKEQQFMELIQDK